MITTPTTMALEVVTPQQAVAYLETAAPNRGIRQGVVDQYARDMSNGRWHSSVIRFGVDEQLWDGQHRLWAVVKSGADVPFWIERNVPLDAIKTIDVGMRRTVGDILNIRGEISANILAGAIRMGRYITLFPGRAPSGASRLGASTAEIVEYLDANPDIRDSIPLARRVAHALKFPATIATALHYLESQRNPAMADAFWTEIETGAEQRLDTGAYALRQQIISNASRPVGTRMKANELTAVAIKAWNYTEFPRAIKQLRWGLGEPFPIIGKIVTR